MIYIITAFELQVYSNYTNSIVQSIGGYKETGVMGIATYSLLEFLKNKTRRKERKMRTVI